ncbi:MAG: hypothetical protein K6F58_07850 [Bacteroidales bacterium]|nr:hypothetical protein [Bacteroidales bacterium]
MRYYKNADRTVNYLFEPQWGKRPKGYGQDGYLEEQLAKQGENQKS